MLLITIIVSFSEGHHERRRWVHIMWQCNKWWANRLVCLVVHNHLKPICMPNHRVQLHINLTLCLHTLQSNKKYEIRKLWNFKKKSLLTTISFVCASWSIYKLQCRRSWKGFGDVHKRFIFPIFLANNP